MSKVRHGTALLLVTAAIGCSDDTPLPPTAPRSSFESSTPSLSTSSVASIIARSRTPLSGGAMTVFDATTAAFSLAFPNLTTTEAALHDVGDDAFDATFVPAPAPMNAGLGPVFDNSSCTGCHVGDGRGRPPRPGEAFSSMLFRASVPGLGPHGGPNPVPGFGGQLQLRAIPGLTPGLEAEVTYTDSLGRFADGSMFTLHVPHYRMYNPYTPFPPILLISPRTAPFVFGMGLLEAVPDAQVLALADPNDYNRDGISGRPNIVWDVARGRSVLGRFGWKAGAPSLLQQTAGAYNGDMGVTSSLFPAEPCEGARAGCDRHAPEISDSLVRATAFYQATLGVPARRGLSDPQALLGEQVFHSLGCESCHTSTLVTGRIAGVRATSGLIHPYTDLLLHDMGPALADNRPDFLASGSEWRTPPLWGIGLVKTVNGHTNFLHDGRAQSLTEAVLWHGGEAKNARNNFMRISANARAALIAFLESL